MRHEVGNRIEIYFQARQLQVRDLTYILNGFTQLFRSAVFSLKERLGSALNRDEYVLRISEITHHQKDAVIHLRVAAMKKGVALTDPEAIESTRADLTREFYELLVHGDAHRKVASFKKAMERKAPRIVNFTLRLVNTLPSGEERIEGSEKWGAV